MKINEYAKRITAAVFFPAAALALFVSCTTIKKSGTIFDEAFFSRCAIELRTAEIVADYVSQADSLPQFKKTAVILLENAGLAAGGCEGFLDISITQRTFLRGVEPKNSIYVSARLFDADNRLFTAFTRAQEGSENIISAVSQYRQLEKLVRDITAFRIRICKKEGQKR